MLYWLLPNGGEMKKEPPFGLDAVDDCQGLTVPFLLFVEVGQVEAAAPAPRPTPVRRSVSQRSRSRTY